MSATRRVPLRWPGDPTALIRPDRRTPASARPLRTTPDRRTVAAEAPVSAGWCVRATALQDERAILRPGLLVRGPSVRATTPGGTPPHLRGGARSMSLLERL